MAKSKNRKKIGDREFMVKRMNKMQKNTLDRAIQISLIFPAIIIEENYGLFTRKDIAGKNRATRMAFACLELLNKLEKNEITQKDLEEKFESFTGISAAEFRKFYPNEVD